MDTPKRIIVTRFSAMGDVAMVASVLKDFSDTYPDVELVMVSRQNFKDFFREVPNLQFYSIEPKGKHKGFLGLYKLYKELSRHHPDALADLHYNLRSRIIALFFSFTKVKVSQLDKGRKEKKELVSKKILIPLKPTIERYADVFRGLGFKFSLKDTLQKSPKIVPILVQDFLKTSNKNIGIAPFAQHAYKMLPLPKMRSIVSSFTEKGYNCLILGGGKYEKEIAETWEREFPHVLSLIGKYSLDVELNIISNLDLMLSMDSSGMHMASLMGVRCVSIWGATHPYAGFLGYGQSINDVVQVEHLNRPSSVYGNKPCDCDGVEAIDLVTPEMVLKKIYNAL